MHTDRVPAPHNHSHHNQCRIPYAAVHTLVLLMMGIMMPETCWDKSLIINIRLVASCWFLSLHPTFMMHGPKSLKFGGVLVTQLWCSTIRFLLKYSLLLSPNYYSVPANSCIFYMLPSGLTLSLLPAVLLLFKQSAGVSIQDLRGWDSCMTCCPSRLVPDTRRN